MKCLLLLSLVDVGTMNVSACWHENSSREDAQSCSRGAHLKCKEKQEGQRHAHCMCVEEAQVAKK